MASPYYIEPVNILPGLQMLGEGLNRRAEMARQNAARAEEAENMKLAEEAIKSGDPDAVNAAMLKNPKLAPIFQTMMGVKDKQDLERETDTIMRILSEPDPTAKANIIIEEAEKAKEAGEDIKPFVDMGIMATRGDVKAIDGKLALMLAATNPKAYDAYKLQKEAEKGPKLNISQERADYEKSISEGSFTGTWPEYVKTMAEIKRKPEPDEWQPWGHGQMRNKRTGEIKKVPVAPRQSSFAAIDREPTKREKDLANMLARNEIDISQLPKRGDSFNMIVAMAKQINPDLNVRELTSDFSLAKNPTFRQKAIVAESVDDIIDEVVRAGKKVDFSNIKAYGSFQKFVKEQRNDPALAEYMTLRNDGLMELAFVMRGAGMTDQAHKAEQEAMNPTMSPRALDAWARAQKRALKPRLERYNRITKTGQEEPKEQPGTKFEKLPNPASLSGKTIRDDKTGTLLKSDGKRWVKVK